MFTFYSVLYTWKYYGTLYGEILSRTFGIAFATFACQSNFSSINYLYWHTQGPSKRREMENELPHYWEESVSFSYKIECLYAWFWKLKKSAHPDGILKILFLSL